MGKATHIMGYGGVYYWAYYDWAAETFDGEYGAWIIVGTIWDDITRSAA